MQLPFSLKILKVGQFPGEKAPSSCVLTAIQAGSHGGGGVGWRWDMCPQGSSGWGQVDRQEDTALPAWGDMTAGMQAGLQLRSVEYAATGCFFFSISWNGSWPSFLLLPAELNLSLPTALWTHRNAQTRQRSALAHTQITLLGMTMPGTSQGWAVIFS